jgi:hypothetical protein
MPDINNVLSFLKKAPNNTTSAVILHDAEERQFPATMPVLRMSLVDDQIHFSVAKEEDINGALVYTPLQQMAFDLMTFINAIDLIIGSSIEE